MRRILSSPCKLAEHDLDGYSCLGNDRATMNNLRVYRDAGKDLFRHPLPLSPLIAPTA